MQLSSSGSAKTGSLQSLMFPTIDRERSSSSSRIWITLLMNLPTTYCATPPLTATNPVYKALDDGRTMVTYPRPTDMGMILPVPSSDDWFDQVNDLDDSPPPTPPPKTKKKKRGPDSLWLRYQAGCPNVGPLGEDRGRYQFIVEYGNSKPCLVGCCSSPDSPVPTPPSTPYCKPDLPPAPPSPPAEPPLMLWQQQPIPCYMATSSEGISRNFPPTVDYEDADRRHHKWKITPPNVLDNNGLMAHNSSVESQLNWQAENALVQNQYLTKLLSYQEHHTLALRQNEGDIRYLKSRIESLHQELMTIAMTVKDSSQASYLISGREKEKRMLEEQLRLAQTQNYPASPTLFPDSVMTPAYHDYQAPHSFPTAMFKELQDQQRHLAAHKARSAKPKRSHDLPYPSVPQPVFQPSPINIAKPMVQPTFQPLPEQPSGPPGFVPWVPPRSKPSPPDSAYTVVPAPAHPNTLSDYLTQLTLAPPSIPALAISKVSSVTTFSDLDSQSSSGPLPVYQTKAPDDPQATEPIIYSSDSEVDTASHTAPHAPQQRQHQPQAQHPTMPPQVQAPSPFGNQDPKQLFTFDGLPFHKWPERISEFHAWLTAKC
ncbi:uncharacterized protein C6orf132-like [Telopea speciosissima]|uniref:uncharacterized protein C6orf132-like n=1 Tax=Telopea speciosissima TaxID=54955 RepID=UPI001CC5D1B3|nr:uncharacterized protein C6orf132-like [Telopea speciosissima]